MAKKKPKRKRPPKQKDIHPVISDDCKESLDDAKTIYIYTEGHDWSLTQLATEFKDVKDCSLGNLRRHCQEENWVEQRRRFRGAVDRHSKDPEKDLANKKKSEQALSNVNRLERLIGMLMARFANSDTMIIKSDYEAAKLLRSLMETQTDIFDSIDATTLKGIKGHKFNIVRIDANDEDDQESDLEVDLEDTKAS